MFKNRIETKIFLLYVESVKVNLNSWSIIIIPYETFKEYIVLVLHDEP